MTSPGLPDERYVIRRDGMNVGTSRAAGAGPEFADLTLITRIPQSEGYNPGSAGLRQNE